MIVATDTNFAEQVETQSGLTIVDFWAPWCVHCHKLSPILDAIAAEGKARVVKMNTDENPATPARLGVSGIPTMLFYKDGQHVGRIIGAAGRQRIEAALAEYA